MMVALAALPCLVNGNNTRIDKHSVEYEFYTIDPRGHGEDYIDAHGVNNARQVVVAWWSEDDGSHAALWQQGHPWKMLDYINPDPDVATGTYLTSLNEHGQAFGTYWTGSTDWSIVDSEPAAVIDIKKGTWHLLPQIPDFPYNQGVSMNNAGQSVGWAFNDDGEMRHWIWDGTQYLFPTYPEDWDVSGAWSGPEFINDAGQIGGQYADETGLLHGFFQDGEHFLSIDAPGAPDLGTVVNGITESGDILLSGVWQLDSNSTDPFVRNFVWSKGQFEALPNVPFSTAIQTSIFGINERGDLCGRWVDENRLQHAFVAFKK